MSCLPAHQFLGDPSNYTHVNTWSTTYYKSTPTAANKYAWTNWAVCTTAYSSMCEIPKTYFDCPTSPPPMPPPSPYDNGLCECLCWCWHGDCWQAVCALSISCGMLGLGSTSHCMLRLQQAMLMRHLLA
jgi:hypothetical protein